MAYTTPTAADFKAIYPSFAAVAEIAVDAAIAEGEGRVDDTWVERDRSTATMLYAAHVLTLNGQGSGTDAQLAAQGLGDFQKVKSGGLEVARFDRPFGGQASELESTGYGKRFRELLRLNHGGPRGVPRPLGHCCHPSASDC